MVVQPVPQSDEGRDGLQQVPKSPPARAAAAAQDLNPQLKPDTWN